MAGFDGSNNNNNGKERLKLKNGRIYDDDNHDEDPSRLPQTSLEVVFGCEVLLSEVLPYLGVLSITDKKRVSRQWKEECDAAINNKGEKTKRRFFVDRAELRSAVLRYCNGNRDDIEAIAEEYGYPIGKWDVSRVEEFSIVFYNMTTFNEDISSWDVGNATNMEGMFQWARSFDQSLSDWDVSNVKNMCRMFFGARAFNGDVSSWDTSGVTDMSMMFSGAAAFDGDISAWNVSSSPAIVSTACWRRRRHRQWWRRFWWRRRMRRQRHQRGR